MLELSNITFACSDPDTLADFWAAALSWRKEEAPPGFIEQLRAAGKDTNMAAAVSDPSGRGPRLFFEKKDRATGRPMPIHLDMRADDRLAEVARLVSLGAEECQERTFELGDHRAVWTVMRDPEGNGFCVQ